MNDINKKLRRIAAAILCVPILAASCGNNENTDTPDTEVTEKTEILTNVFKGTRATLPEDYSVNSSIKPYYNAESGELRFVCSYWHESETENGDGYYDYIRDYFIVTFDGDGTLTNEQKIPLDDDIYINNAFLTEDKLYFVNNTYDSEKMTQSYKVGIIDLNDGTTTYSDNVTSLFDNVDERWFYIGNIAVDGDGTIYISADEEVVVMNSEFVKQFSVPTSGWIDSMECSADGTVYVSGYFDDGNKMLPIDKTTKSLGAEITVPYGMNASQILFGDGYELYVSNTDGLYGYSGTDDTDAELLFSYANSDISGNSVNIATVIDRDCVVIYEQDPETYDYLPVIYRRSDDIDLSQIKVLEIAFTESAWNLAANIVNFNKANDGVRIIARDYSVYNTDEDYDAGTTKLINDILNGIYKPDLITDYLATTKLISQIYENDLYTDLYPLMEADGDIKKDDILGCVKRSFETEGGGLWAIGGTMQVSTLLGTREMLGDRTGWTLSEMIDFALSLPEGTQLKYGLTRDSASYDLLGQNGYGMFIDTETNTCDFENEAFIKYLEYIQTLPETYEQATAETENLDYSERYILYHSGKIALADEYYYGINDWVGTEAVFNTSDVVRIGYPTADGTTSGAEVEIAPYIITSFCEYPDEAWDFIKSIIKPDESSSIRYYGSGLPILKDEFMKECENEYNSLFEIYFSGGMSWGEYNPEYDDLESEMNEPGIRKFFTEEDAKEMLRWFDEEAGSPVSHSVSDEITAIVNEEITGYLGGAKTASDCAKIIQSRVSLWLSEHE